MLDKIQAIPEKRAFAIGITLILFGPLLLFLMSLLFHFANWKTMIIEGIIWIIASLLITYAVHKKHSDIEKKK
ncbi:hypothetical protein BGM25_25010 [Bacillus sp. FJAT-29953]|nr:hypothetical protein [Bacillus sp. FJAT-29953]